MFRSDKSLALIAKKPFTQKIEPQTKAGFEVQLFDRARDCLGIFPRDIRWQNTHTWITSKSRPEVS